MDFLKHHIYFYSTDDIGILTQIVIAAVAGILSQLISEKLKQPSILFLLLSGLALGPHGFRVINPHGFQSELTFFVELAVVIIVFEGALSLKLDQFLKNSIIIRRLTTTGAMLTIIICGLGARFFVGTGWILSFMFGALVSVTGPTVIGPMIKRINIKNKIASILHWESIVLDPVGVIVSIILLEVIMSKDTFSFTPILSFLIRFAVGIFTGLILGYVGKTLLKIKNLATIDTKKNLILVLALGCYTLSEYFFSHSGLVAVVVLGIIIGNSDLKGLEPVLQFKEVITTFLLSLVFVLLAANLNLLTIQDLGFAGIGLLVVVIFVARPLNIFLSTLGTHIDTKAKVYLSWIAPRGIIAASMASLLAISLKKTGYPDADKLEAMVYLVILATVFLQGLSAGFLARLLGVTQKKKTGFLLVGAGVFPLALGNWLRSRGYAVTFMDTDETHVYKARKEGFEAHQEALIDEAFVKRAELFSVGTLLAVSVNDALNILCGQMGTHFFDKNSCYLIKGQVEDFTQMDLMGCKPVLEWVHSTKKFHELWENHKYQFKSMIVETPPKPGEPLILSNFEKGWPFMKITPDQVTPLTLKEPIKKGDNLLLISEFSS